MSLFNIFQVKYEMQEKYLFLVITDYDILLMGVICDLYNLSNYSNIYIVFLEDQGLPEEDFWKKKNPTKQTYLL